MLLIDAVEQASRPTPAERAYHRFRRIAESKRATAVNVWAVSALAFFAVGTALIEQGQYWVSVLLFSAAFSMSYAVYDQVKVPSWHKLLEEYSDE